MFRNVFQDVLIHRMPLVVQTGTALIVALQILAFLPAVTADADSESEQLCNEQKTSVAFRSAKEAISHSFAERKATLKKSSTRTHGISASFVPAKARPGDIVELRVEMVRETWGRFKLQIPDHPRLRAIAEERIPVSYTDGLYQQRQSLMLQAVSSGAIVIGGASAIVSTPNGNQTVVFPDLTLNVQAFLNIELSDSPLPLPPPESDTKPSSKPFWIGFAGTVSVFLLLIVFVLKWNRKSALHHDEPDSDMSRTNEIVQQLRSGDIPNRELEQLLNDPGLSISAELRSMIERAVYSVKIPPAELATLLQKELPA